MIWLPSSVFNDKVQHNCLERLKQSLPTTWTFNISLYHAVDFGDPIIADRYVLSLFKITHEDLSTSIISCVDLPSSGFIDCLMSPPPTDCVMNNLQLNPASLYAHAPQKDANAVTIVHSSLQMDVACIHFSNIILDPYYPAIEPPPIEYQNNLFGRRFGVLVTYDNSYGTRCISNTELLR